MEFRYSKLRGRIVEKCGSITAFSEKIKISRAALNNKLSNRTDISREDIIEWSTILEIEPKDYASYFFDIKVNTL